MGRLGVDAVIVQNINNPKGIHIHQPLANLEGEPGDPVNKGMGKHEKSGLEGGCARADKARCGALHQFVSAADTDGDGKIVRHRSHRGGPRLAGCRCFEAKVRHFLRYKTRRIEHDGKNAAHLAVATPGKRPNKSGSRGRVDFLAARASRSGWPVKIVRRPLAS